MSLGPTPQHRESQDTGAREDLGFGRQRLMFCEAEAATVCAAGYRRSATRAGEVLRRR